MDVGIYVYPRYKFRDVEQFKPNVVHRDRSLRMESLQKNDSRQRSLRWETMNHVNQHLWVLSEAVTEGRAINIIFVPSILKKSKTSYAKS